jgi:preprotein translocase subunit SecF
MHNSLKINFVKKKRFTTVSILIFTMLFSLILAGCSGSNYGTKLNFGGNNELYYTDSVTLEEAQVLGDYLVEADFFAKDSNTRSVQLNKNGSTYEFRMVMKKGLDQDQDTIDLMKLFIVELSDNVFNGESVDAHLCDETFKTLRVVVAN